jgi:antitoxin component YwqK of YwqJK toxin-antitoxin module
MCHKSMVTNLWSHGVLVSRAIQTPDQRTETEYMNGKKHGKEITTIDHRVVNLRYYVNGELDGPEEEWYPNGKIHFRSNWVRGKRYGEEITWWENGKVGHVVFRVDDKPHGEEIVWWDNGNIGAVITWKNGKRSGHMQHYFRSGNRRYCCCYYDGIIVGAERMWYENGQLAMNAIHAFEYEGYSDVYEGDLHHYLENGDEKGRRSYEPITVRTCPRKLTARVFIYDCEDYI